MDSPGRRRPFDPLLLVGLVVTALLHLGVFAALWLTRGRADASKPPPGPGIFVDAQLVKFGKPRDLSFLPHKQGRMQRTGPAVGLKVAKDDQAAPSQKKDEEPPEVVDPLKQTRAELFKQLVDDDRPIVPEEEGGSLTGSRAGTATEAKGDPYILYLIDEIGSRWTVPTTIRIEELGGLSADVCLTIDEAGTLAHFEFTRRSGNSQFDSSLEATLGTISALRSPPERFAAIAARGRLCPTFSKQ